MGARPNCMYCGSSFGKSVTISGQDAIRAESTLIARIFWCVSGFNSKLELQATMHESPDAPTINLIYCKAIEKQLSSIGTTRRPWTLATLEDTPTLPHVGDIAPAPRRICHSLGGSHSPLWQWCASQDLAKPTATWETDSATGCSKIVWIFARDALTHSFKFQENSHWWWIQSAVALQPWHSHDLKTPANCKNWHPKSPRQSPYPIHNALLLSWGGAHWLIFPAFLLYTLKNQCNI